MPVIKVVECEDDDLPFSGEGKVINSPLLNGLGKKGAIEKIINVYLLERKNKEETFIQTFNKIGLDPFKESLYDNKHK